MLVKTCFQGVNVIRACFHAFLLVAIYSVYSIAHFGSVSADETTDRVPALDVDSKTGMPLARWDMQRLVVPPDFRWLDSQSVICSLLYRGEDYHGQPTEIFAYYASPATLAGKQRSGGKYPGIVLLHGGGGTAFSEWAENWARRGYAAIAMDLGGKRPALPMFDQVTGQVVQRFDHIRGKRQRVAKPGPLDDHKAKFQNVNEDPTDDWQFHAVSAAVRAHSLLRSFPDVDPERTAVTGISWGGYLTCLTASVDSRFKAAVPVYGCGFLFDGESVQRTMIDRLGPKQRAEWISWHDPSRFLPHCRVPIFFVNGTNDKHYPLKSYAQTYKLVQGPVTLRIKAGMRHSHLHGWAPLEIGRFIDQYLLKKDAMVELAEPVLHAGVVSCAFPAQQSPSHAVLQYTSDRGPLVDRKWKSIEASLATGLVSAKLPADATIWCLAVTGEDDAVVTSEVMFRRP
ncbi:MAG: acylamino acid-releasing protein [Rhodopirellula sp.]|nr:acylamino acid-releasing protein [Rhodopirellula sp.]